MPPSVEMSLDTAGGLWGSRNSRGESRTKPPPSLAVRGSASCPTATSVASVVGKPKFLEDRVQSLTPAMFADRHKRQPERRRSVFEGQCRTSGGRSVLFRVILKET